MKWKFDEGDKAMFTCSLSTWRGIGSVPCTVIRRLTDSEADLAETGPMYMAKLNGKHGKLVQAFEDELRHIDGR